MEFYKPQTNPWVMHLVCNLGENANVHEMLTQNTLLEGKGYW